MSLSIRSSCFTLAIINSILIVHFTIYCIYYVYLFQVMEGYFRNEYEPLRTLLDDLFIYFPLHQQENWLSIN